MVTAAGCSQMWSPPQGQEPMTTARSLPVPAETSALDAPHLKVGSVLSPLIKNMLTPHPSALEAAGLPSSPVVQAPAISGGPIAEATVTGSGIQLAETATATPTTGVPTATPLPQPAPQGPPTLLLDVANSNTGVGQEVEIQLLLSSAPTGISGFILDLEISDPQIAEIVSGTFPSFGLATVSTLPAASAKMQAVDLSQIANPTSDEVLLATVKVKGKARGSTEIRVIITRVDDDDGQPVDPPTQPIMLTVQ